MKFNHLNVPDNYQHYWTRYPEGYTILEALLTWVKQVDDMVDNVNKWNDYLDDFVSTFDKELQIKVTNILSDWQQSGFLDVVINEALDTKYHEMDNRLTAQLAQTMTRDEFESWVSTLLDGGPSIFMDSLSELQTTYPNGAPGVALVRETDPAKIYVWNGSAWEDFGDYQGLRTKEFIATNVISNGNFTDGLNGGWKSVYSSTTVSNGVASNVKTSDSTFGQLGQDITNLIVGDKYYLKANVKPLGSPTYVAVGANYANESPSTVNNPITNIETTVSGVFTLTNSSASLFVRHAYADKATIGTLEVNNMLAFNLSKTFGKGYEPSAEEVDKLLTAFNKKWFDASEQIATSEYVYKKLIENNSNYQPLLDIPRTGFMVKGDNNTYHGRQIQGTTNQIEVINADGVAGHPQIKIPTNPTLMRPEVISTTYGDDIAPEISTWTGVGGVEFSNGAWTIQPKGQLKTTLSVEAGAEYEVEIKWTDTNNYGVLDIPRLVVKFGDITLPGQFTGYSDAGYKFVVKSEITGNVKLTLGDGVEDWYAVITDVIIRKVISKATPSGKLGAGSFEVLTVGTNIAIGAGLKKRTSGDYNTAYGYDALRDNTVGTYNTAIGARALQQNTTGYHNIGIGFQAMQEMKSGYYNTGVGYSVMRHITTGNWNVAMGNEAMRNISSGIRNTSIGSRSMNDLTTGSFNTAMGREAGMFPNEKGYTTKTGNNNVFLGYRTGQSHDEETDESTAVGSYATARTRGTSLGRKALAGGVGSVAIGTDSTGVGAEAQSDNEFVLGTENHKVSVKGRFNIKRFTPSGSSDPQGNVGDITSDDDYIYTKTTTGWKRSVLESW